MSHRRGRPASSCGARIHHQRRAAHIGADRCAARPQQRRFRTRGAAGPLCLATASHGDGFRHNHSAAVGFLDPEPPSSSPATTPRALHFMTSFLQSTEAPNHALQRTAPAVTAAASSLRLSPTAQPPRQPPPSLSLGSLGVARALRKGRISKKRHMPTVKQHGQ